MRTAGISCSVRPKEDDEVTESSREKHAGCRGWAATVRLNRTAGSKEKELTTGGKQNAPCTQAKPGGVKHCECNVAADTPKRAKPQKHRVSALFARRRSEPGGAPWAWALGLGPGPGACPPGAALLRGARTTCTQTAESPTLEKLISVPGGIPLL